MTDQPIPNTTQRRLRDLLLSERFITILALVITMVVVALVPALDSSEADLIDAFKAIAMWVILGGAVSELVIILYPIAVRITRRTPDPRDDYALAIVVAVLQALGFKLPTIQEEGTPVEQPPAS